MVNDIESNRQIKEADITTSEIWSHWRGDHRYTVGLFQWSDACSRQTGGDWEDYWRQGDHDEVLKASRVGVNQRLDFDLHLDNLVITGVEMRRLSASNNQPIISNTKAW